MVNDSKYAIKQDSSQNLKMPRKHNRARMQKSSPEELAQRVKERYKKKHTRLW